MTSSFIFNLAVNQDLRSKAVLTFSYTELIRVCQIMSRNVSFPVESSFGRMLKATGYIKIFSLIIFLSGNIFLPGNNNNIIIKQEWTFSRKSFPVFIGCGNSSRVKNEKENGSKFPRCRLFKCHIAVKVMHMQIIWKNPSVQKNSKGDFCGWICTKDFPFSIKIFQEKTESP